jgi:hypothetical protein
MSRHAISIYLGITHLQTMCFLCFQFCQNSGRTWWLQPVFRCGHVSSLVSRLLVTTTAPQKKETSPLIGWVPIYETNSFCWLRSVYLPIHIHKNRNRFYVYVNIDGYVLFTHIIYPLHIYIKMSRSVRLLQIGLKQTQDYSCHTYRYVDWTCISFRGLEENMVVYFTDVC